MIWSDRLIEAGFKPSNPMVKEYRPKDNWHGCSQYAPDQWLTKGSFEVKISLQGMLTGRPETVEQRAIMKVLGAKYVAVLENKTLLWETFFGENIPDEIMTKLTA